jgi:FixJ family two-component response regulator
MRANGFESRCFTSPQQLLDEITAEPYGCVVLDISSVEMMGTKLHAQLKERKIDMPIIAISARDDSGTRECAHRIGAQFFLSKPVDDHALLDTIAWVTETRNKRTDVEGDAGS